MSAQGRSEALVPERAARRWSMLAKWPSHA
jgi:hypothetical protein